MRKAKPKKRYYQPDPRFNDTNVSQFINNLMWDGKKSTAQTIFYDAVDQVSEKTGENGFEVWKKALANLSPSVEVKSRRIGGANFQIPTEVKPARKVALSMQWLIAFSRKRTGRSMSEKLAAETIAASKGEGAAYKKKEDVHRMAEANKAFSHFKF
ncbi:MAG: 30S ribosomal protein S7 [Bacteroidota bacterium]